MIDRVRHSRIWGYLHRIPQACERQRAIDTTTRNGQVEAAATLGSFLRDRRSRLQPPADRSRRRTPGLRREEIAARASVSITWYTWLEQGRRGPPSVEVLERLARALELDAASREIMFLLAQHRPPPLSSASVSVVPPTLQRVLDSMRTCPAFVRTVTWDIVAWNSAAITLIDDYGALEPRERNVLRRLFCDQDAKRLLPSWEEHARAAVSVFRLDAARAGHFPEAQALAAELRETNADFRRLWAENDVSSHGIGVQRLKQSEHGLITLERSSFAVSGAEGLTMVVFTPAAPADAEALDALLLPPANQS